MFTRLSTYSSLSTHLTVSLFLSPLTDCLVLPSPFSCPLSLYPTVWRPIHSHVWTPFLCSCDRPSSYLFTDQLLPGLPFLFLHNTHLLHPSAVRSSIHPVSHPPVTMLLFFFPMFL